METINKTIKVKGMIEMEPYTSRNGLCIGITGEFDIDSLLDRIEPETILADRIKPELIKAYVQSSCNPEDIFTSEELGMWALNNGFILKEDNK